MEEKKKPTGWKDNRRTYLMDWFVVSDMVGAWR